MTPDEIALCERMLDKWEHEWDEKLKGHLERIADEMGCCWWDIVMENRDLFLDGPGDHWNPDA